jgi:monoamine oxidase
LRISDLVQLYPARMSTFFQRLDSFPEHAPDVAAATFLEPRGRWNGLIGAVGSYVSGADLERVSARDFQRYDDSGVKLSFDASSPALPDRS